MPSQTQNSPRILIIRRRYIGDLVLMGPVFRNLRLHHPNAWIAVLVDVGYEDVLSRNSDLNEIITLPCKSGGFIEGFRLLRNIRSRRFDIVYDFTRNDRSSLISLCSGAGERVGFRVDERRRLRDRIYTTQAFWSVEDHKRYHIVDLYLKLLEASHIPVTTRVVGMTVAPDDQKKAHALINKVVTRKQGELLVMVHPGARAASRLWPVENFAAVCDEIQSRYPAKVVLVASSKEQELVTLIGARVQTKVAIITDTVSIPVLAAMLKEADLFIGHDSGPIHIAAAVGTPVIVLFGAQKRSIWEPRGEHCVTLQAPMPCNPCAFPDKCQPGDSDKMFCVRKISVAAVLAAVEQQLRRAHG